jgi:hypothetical protein
MPDKVVFPTHQTCARCGKTHTVRLFRYTSRSRPGARIAQVQGDKCRPCRLAWLTEDKTGKRINNAEARLEISPPLATQLRAQLAATKAAALEKIGKAARKKTSQRWADHRAGIKPFRTTPKEMEARLAQWRANPAVPTTKENDHE